MTRPESDRVHTWFELSYSDYQVVPRVLMQSMPDEWQHQMVDCLEELRDAYSHVEQAPGYEVNPVRWTYVSELSDGALAVAGVTCEERDGETYYWDRHGNEVESHERVGLPVDEPLPHYNRGRAYVEPRLDRD